MERLDDYRNEINEIDAQMAALFKQRMQLCQSIGAYKKEHMLPVKDAAREEAVLAKGRELMGGSGFEPYYLDFQKKVMDISCSLQHRIINGIRVGYSGVPGAYAYIAAKRLFPDAELIPFANFQPAYKAAEKGEIDCAVLPLENSYAGEVGAVMDLMFSGSLSVNQVLSLDIEHYLLGIPGSDASKIKTVVSHPQALAQCDEYIQEHGFETIEYSNTARAAQHVRDLGDPTVAAVASVEAAPLFGLEVLERKIHSVRYNSSRFGVFSRVQNLPKPEEKADSCSFILLFTVPHEAGALAMTLDIIGSHGFNMRNLKSRPMKGLLWNYYFYLEVEGNISTEDGQRMLREIGALCGTLKLAGSYKTEV